MIFKKMEAIFLSFVILCVGTYLLGHEIKYISDFYEEVVDALIFAM